MFKKLLLIAVSFFSIVGFCQLDVFSQSNQTTPKLHTISPPGNIQLPLGFVYERRQGIDSHVGAFIRSDGFTINHDIGRMAANYAYRYFPEHFEKLRKQTHLNTGAIEREVKYLEGQIEWRQRQKINGDDVMAVLLKDSTLIVSFANSTANFTAKIDSHEKLADFFLIVLTYQPSFDKEK